MQEWTVFVARTNVLDLAGGEVTGGEERGGRQGVDPVLGPEQVQQASINAGLEVGDVEAVVGLAMHAKVLDLAQRDRLVF